MSLQRQHYRVIERATGRTILIFARTDKNLWGSEREARALVGRSVCLLTDCPVCALRVVHT